MRIDYNLYKKDICPKCEKYFNGKLEIGKCMATDRDIYTCVRKEILKRDPGMIY